MTSSRMGIRTLGMYTAHVDAQRYYFWKVHAERSLARNIGPAPFDVPFMDGTHNGDLPALAMSLDR